MSDQQTKVRKVRAYPFPASLVLGTATIQGKIVKLTPLGFLIECSMGAMKPGDKFEVKFELPVLHVVVAEPCILVKTYSHWGPGGDVSVPQQDKAEASDSQQNAPVISPAATPPKVSMLLEGHFQGMSLQGKERIVSFLNALGKPGV